MVKSKMFFKKVSEVGSEYTYWSMYRNYQMFFYEITLELEKIYHTLWDRRKESTWFRMMGKQAKTAWSLWKIGFPPDWTFWYSNPEKLQFTNDPNKRYASGLTYVNSSNNNRFAGDYPDSDLDDGGYFHYTKERWFLDSRHLKARDIAMPYLARTMMNWRDGSTVYYSDLLATINRGLLEMIEFFKSRMAHCNHRQGIKDLEEALKLLQDAQSCMGEPGEREAWMAFFELMNTRYYWWDD